jgi:hypothetical protein
MVRLLAYSILPLDGAFTMLALYLTIPVVVMAGLVGCHHLLARLCPRLLGMVNGGR